MILRGLRPFRYDCNDDVVWAAINGEIQAVADTLAAYRKEKD